MYASPTITNTPTFITRYNSQSFDWLTWRNGSLKTIFKIHHKYDQIVANREIIRKYAVGYCEAEQVPCRPKIGFIAIMFRTDDNELWWTHLTRKEFMACFPENASDIRN